MGKGIDYGLGRTNIDRETGIRYGVIPMNSLAHWAYESFEPDYGDPHCPECGQQVYPPDEIASADLDAGQDFRCINCHKNYWSNECYGEEMIGSDLDDGEYKAHEGSDGDVFVLKSPYYTRAQFCSPCAPGACHLENPTSDGEKAYCFGHDWFEDGIAPYPVFRVSDDSPVEPEREPPDGENGDIDLGGSD